LATGLGIAALLAPAADAATPAPVSLGDGLVGQPTAEPSKLPTGVVTREVAPADAGAKLIGGVTGGTGMVTPMTVTREQISTGSGWVTLRGAPGSFTAALGRNGWGFDRSAYSAPWRFGWIQGSSTSPVTGCLWLQDGQSSATGGTPTADCSPYTSLQEHQYIKFWNDNIPSSQGGNCTADWQCDGSPRTIDPAACPNGAPVLSNVRPWMSGGAGTDTMYTVPAGQTVLWRYVDADGGYSMIRYNGPRANPTASAGAQDWGFIKAGCITNYGYNVGPRN
jgi:hypothetical protein